jgi:CRISPR-associated protein Csb2
MLAITVRLVHGTIRAGSPDDTVMAGEPRGEWPPSPARLFSALVAADGTRARCRVTDGTELLRLEQLGPPDIYADADPASSPLNSRFVVRDVNVEGFVQGYPARSSAEVRPGVKISPRDPVIVYVWDAELPVGTVDALRRRAARVGYLGCADSPVQITVSTEAPSVELPRWRPGARAGVSLPVPYPGFLDALDHAYDVWSAGGAMRRSWVPTRRERYAIDRSVDEVTALRGTTLWFEFNHRVAANRALLVAETLRAAVLERADTMFEGDVVGRRAPWQLHGHDIPSEVTPPYQLARFLALPNVGHRHSDGAIHGAAVWLPPDLGAEAVEAVRIATGHLRTLRAAGLDVEIRPRFGEGGKWSTRPKRWVGPAHHWFSATPVVAERGSRRGPGLADVQAWFEHAGFPPPVEARVSPVPTRSGVHRLRPRDVHRPGKQRHPFYWLEVRFDAPVEGPICVGRSRSFGMGLFAPLTGAGSEKTREELA